MDPHPERSMSAAPRFRSLFCGSHHKEGAAAKAASEEQGHTKGNVCSHNNPEGEAEGLKGRPMLLDSIDSILEDLRRKEKGNKNEIK